MWQLIDPLLGMTLDGGRDFGVMWYQLVARSLVVPLKVVVPAAIYRWLTIPWKASYISGTWTYALSKRFIGIIQWEILIPLLLNLNKYNEFLYVGFSTSLVNSEQKKSFSGPPKYWKTRKLELTKVESSHRRMGSSGNISTITVEEKAIQAGPTKTQFTAELGYSA